MNLNRFNLLQFLSIFYHKTILKNLLSRRLNPYIVKYHTNNLDNTWDASKYLDLDTWVLQNLGRVFQLELNKKKEISILDISTGCGYFPFISNYFGNFAEGTDLTDCEVYNDVINELDITRQICHIVAFKKINIKGRYDLITSFMICFNNHQQPNLWHIEEWDYFLNNLIKDHLKTNGEIFLSFNPEKDEEPVRVELLNYFLSKNAIVTKDSVHFKSNSLKSF